MDEELHAEWFRRPALCVGGRISYRRADPLPGWWLIREGRASGPFDTANMAEIFSLRGDDNA